MNMQKALSLLKDLHGVGVETIALCPGGRNAPFVQLLDGHHSFEVVSFFDERSAGFFALGRAQETARPVAVLTTSGTAVSELHSSVIEAYYRGTPLVVVSADRPPHMRGTGAPQTINQSHLFGEHAQMLDVTGAWSGGLDWDQDKPLHINICFDEPLIDDDCGLENWSPVVVESTRRKSFEIDLSKLEKPMVVVSGLEPTQRPAVVEFLKTLSVPIYCESLSGLGEFRQGFEFDVRGGSRVVETWIKNKSIGSIVRIGDIPVGRFWRDLESSEIEVLSLSDKKFPGLSHSQFYEHSLDDFSQVLPPQGWSFDNLKAQDEEIFKKVMGAMEEAPLSEVGLLKSLSGVIPKEAFLYIGNSLPIREWELLQSEHQNLGASRGVNGIDGQLSTAMGRARPNQEMWVVLGDLTSLYDFSAFWLTSYLQEKNISLKLVIINNGGGQIFSRLFKSPLFLNSHSLGFEPLAEMWGWRYQKINQWSDFESQKGLEIIELLPDPEQTKKFWQLWSGR